MDDSSSDKRLFRQPLFSSLHFLIKFFNIFFLHSVTSHSDKEFPQMKKNRVFAKSQTAIFGICQISPANIRMQDIFQ